MLRYHEDIGELRPSVKLERVLLFSTKDVNTGFPGHDVDPDDNVPWFDLTTQVEELVISESIHSLALTGHVVIADGLNEFEEVSIHGQEMLFVHLNRPFVDDNSYGGSGNFTNIDDVKRYFYVTSMSLYDREPNRQLYRLEFISPHAYTNALRRLHRPYGFQPAQGGEQVDVGVASYRASDVPDYRYKDRRTVTRPEEMIWHMLVNDLEYPEDRIFIVDETTPLSDQSERPMKVVIPGIRPFAAISWLLRNTLTVHPSGWSFPWLAYETLVGGIRIEPWHAFRTAYEGDGFGFWEGMGREGKVIENPFIYSSFYRNTLGEDGYWEEERRRILELNFGYSFDRYEQALRGTLRTVNAYWNPSVKTFSYPGQEFLTETKYEDNLSEALPYSWKGAYGEGEFLPVADEVESDAPDLTEETNYTYYTVYNSVLHGEPEPDGAGLRTDRDTRPYNYGFRAESPLDYDTRYYWQSLADMTQRNTKWMRHVMKVHGDLFISPGIRLTIEVPKAIDPILLEDDNLEVAYMNKQDIVDEYVSGDYYVIGVDHVLDRKGYTCTCTIGRDFSTVDLDSSGTFGGARGSESTTLKDRLERIGGGSTTPQQAFNSLGGTRDRS